jgi:hypothetical protein
MLRRLGTPGPVLINLRVGRGTRVDVQRYASQVERAFNYRDQTGFASIYGACGTHSVKLLAA